MHPAEPTRLRVQDLGVLAYTRALALQRQTHHRVTQGHDPPTLLLVEHPPVITVSRRPTAGHHLLADPAQLTQLGIEVQPTDRGGDITYHGPGQLVAYPILPLPPLGLNVGRYMRLLEQVVIDAIARYGVRGHRDPDATGVWVTPPLADTPAKLCAVGVRIRRNVSMHGLALNVTTNLDHFRTIVPCGLPDRGVTNLHRLLGDRTPTMTRVKADLSDMFHNHLSALVEPCQSLPSQALPAS